MKYLLRFIMICIGLLFVPPSYASFFGNMVKGFIAQAEVRHEMATAPPCTLSVNEAYAHSIELLSDGRQAEAEEFLSSAIKCYREDERILMAKAVVERSRWCNQETAEVWFRLLIRKASKDYRTEAARLQMSLDQHKKADENMKELVRISDEQPDDVYLLWLTAIQCREQSKREDVSPDFRLLMAKLGKKQYEKLISKFRIGPVMLHHTYANILEERLGEYEKALHHHLRAVSMEASSWSLEGLADTLYKLGDYDWANAIWARAVRLDPSSTRCQNRWGDTLYKLKCYAEAEKKYRAEIVLNPDGERGWSDLGRVLYQQGRYEESVVACEKAANLNPEEGFSWYWLSCSLGKLNRYEEMVSCCEKAIERGRYWAAGDLGWCYQFGYGVEKDIKKACELYLLCSEKTDSDFARWRLAECFAEGTGVEKDLKASVKYYEEALSIDPDDVDALSSYAWQLATNSDESFHDYSKAVMLAEKSVAAEEQPCNLNTLAVAYEKNGQHELAVQTQRRLMEH